MDKKLFEFPSAFEWLQPWFAVDPEFAGTVETELRRELPKGHVLKECRVQVVGESDNYDDFLFVTDNPTFPIAAVHLTWSKETDPNWPSTGLYRSVEDWIEAMKQEHDDYIETVSEED